MAAKTGLAVRFSRVGLGLPQPNVDLLLPDPRGKVLARRKLGRYARPWSLELISRDLEPDWRRSPYIIISLTCIRIILRDTSTSGDVFVLRVSHRRDENGRDRYVDISRKNWVQSLWMRLCDRAAVVVRVFKTTEDVHEQRAAWGGFGGHRPLKGLYTKLKGPNRKGGAGTTT